MNDTLREKIRLLPQLPGVYRMYDAAGTCIYVGKAINLKNRVSQYFRSQKNMEPKVAAMVSHIEDFSYILTANETEALTLESNLIKALKPRYNILLKDDKHFPYVRVDLRQDFPRFEVVRKVKDDGASYFGPYLSGIALRDALTAIRDWFPVRHCKKDMQKAIARRERPCLMYHVGKCCAPCSGNVSREQYHGYLESICRFLEGNTKPITEMLAAEMYKASENMEFERAAQLRDRIRAVEALGERQQAIAANERERDVFAYCADGCDALVYGLFVRAGKVIGAKGMALSATAGESSGAVMAAFLQQYYADTIDIPAEIAVRDMPEGSQALEIWLREKRGKKVEILCPQRGEKNKQTTMAYQNGMDEMQKTRELERRAWEKGEGALLRLTELLGLDSVPSRMECYDNSHIQGRDTVGSMVVFLDGNPVPNEYRRFRIKANVEGDDYAAMREVLTRRFTHAAAGEEKWASLPDLLIVDGGRGQLNVALEVLEQMGFSHIPAIGLAERRESVILPDDPELLVLAPHDGALHMLERIRDEAHRFAITYHRSLRGKNSLYSQLAEIEGIGEKRRRILFEHFITLDAIKQADVETLTAIKGITGPNAEAIYKYFHP